MLSSTLALTLVLAVGMAGCATYQGQLDTSVPMKEQASLFIDSYLTLTRVDGKAVGIEFISGSPDGSSFSLPSGEHTLTFSYLETSTINGAETTWSAYGLTVIHTFEPGKNYTAYWLASEDDRYNRLSGSNRSGNVAIILMGDRAVPGIAAASETAISMGLGMDLANVIGLQMSVQPIGYIFDMGKVAFGIRGDLAMGIGWAPGRDFGEYAQDKMDAPITLGLVFSGYGMLDFYINQDAGKAFGIGVGGGLAYNFMRLITQEEPTGAPFLRAEIFFRQDSRTNIYFDYYLKDLVDVPVPGHVDPEDYVFSLDDWNTFGVGITWHMY
jgi:hypothetical protein